MEAKIIAFPNRNRRKPDVSAADIDRMVEQELQLSLTRHPAGNAKHSVNKPQVENSIANAKPEFLFPSKMMPEDVQFASAEEINHHRSALDAELAKVSDALGDFQTRRLAKMIQMLSMSIADNAYAEGLSNGFLYLEEQENR
jgi:hypothetical protein